MAARKIVRVRLDGKLLARLEALATITRKSCSFLAEEAIRNYMKLNDGPMLEIRKALGDADRGEFVNDAAVEKVATRWARKARV